MFFDNLTVQHRTGPITEETHYYPFGLTMAGISSKAAGGLENKKKFVGQELDDDLGINLYQFTFRNYDCQIGRFIQIDPLADKYVYNTTYAYAENKFINSIDVEGLEAKLAISGLGHEQTEYAIHPSDANTFKERAQKLTRIANFVASQAENGSQIIQQMKDATANEGSISSVVFFSHSGGAGLYLNNNDGFYTDNGFMVGDNSASVTDLKTAIQGGQIKFDNNAVVVFTGCNTNSSNQLSTGQDPLALSFTKQTGVTTYGSTGNVSPEIVNGKETGRFISDGTFIKNERTVTSQKISFKLPFIGKVNINIPKVTITQTDVGKVIDPKKLVPQN